MKLKWTKEQLRWNPNPATVSGGFRITYQVGGRARGMYGVVGKKASVYFSYDGMPLDVINTVKTGIPTAVARFKRAAEDIAEARVGTQYMKQFLRTRKELQDSIIDMDMVKYWGRGGPEEEAKVTRHSRRAHYLAAELEKMFRTVS